jgi:BioD-like phosphotransacetylase family protein
MAGIESALASAGITPLAVLPEDRVLASPTLAEVAAALRADAQFFDSHGSRLLDHALVASISADPGQGYFARTRAPAVIVRADKPDLQLGALNAGVACLILTGDEPVLSYVLERARSEEIPLLRTRLDTAGAVGAIEGLYAALPFSGGPQKMERLSELTAALDLSALV